MRSYSARLITFVIFAAITAIYACGGDSGSNPTTTGNPTTPLGNVSFDEFQKQVLTPSCATSGCHVSPNPQAGLILSEGSSYTNLFNITPSNATAANDGLKRVMAGKPDSSLLYHK